MQGTPTKFGTLTATPMPFAAFPARGGGRRAGVAPPFEGPPGLAAFDADGTIWDGDLGEAVLLDLIAARKTARSRRPIRGPTTCVASSSEGPAAAFAYAGRLMAGLSEAEVRKTSARVFAADFAQRMFSETRWLLRTLAGRGWDVYIVSASNRWSIEVAAEVLGLPRDRVVALDLDTEQGILTDRVRLPVPTLEGKARAASGPRGSQTRPGLRQLDPRRAAASRCSLAGGGGPLAETARRAQFIPDPGRAAGLGPPRDPGHMTQSVSARVCLLGRFLLSVTLPRGVAAAQEGTLVMPHSDELPPATAAPQMTKLPSIARSVDAVYPPEAKVQGISGDVGLEITLAADGSISDLKVVESAGHGFDEAAVTAVKQFVFTPAEIDGKPAAVAFHYVYHFVIPPPEIQVAARCRRVRSTSPASCLQRATKDPMPGVTVSASTGSRWPRAGAGGAFDFSAVAGAREHHDLSAFAAGYERLAEGRRAQPRQEL